LILGKNWIFGQKVGFLGLGPKMAQNGSKMGPKWVQNGQKLASYLYKGFQNGPKKGRFTLIFMALNMRVKWPKMGPKWVQNGPKISLIFI